jgi:hypothetical protein
MGCGGMIGDGFAFSAFDIENIKEFDRLFHVWYLDGGLGVLCKIKLIGY